MRSYISIFKLRLIQGMQYRVSAYAGIATQFFWGFMLIMVYDAFYASTNTVQPMSFAQIVTFIWLQQSLLYIVMLWYRDGTLFALITDGNISYELCRPINMYFMWYTKLIAGRLAGTILRCSPIIIVALLLPEPYRLTLPPDLPTFILFIISLALALFVVVAISMLMYISVFITLSPSGSSLMFNIIGEFLAGLLIPIPLMPEWMQRIVYLFPFHATCDMPLRIYSGHIPFNDALIGIVTQVIWLIALIAIGIFCMSRALKKVVVNGG